MLIRHTPEWSIPEREATPEAVFLSRRAVIAAGGLAVAGAVVPCIAARADEEDPTSDLYPATRNPGYVLNREITPEALNLAYNNFYEFGSHKQVAAAAQALRTRPWEVSIDGLVEAERTIGIDELIRRFPLEERLYRLRCVEAWAMAIPWTGFPMRALLDFARPLGSAKYVRMETFLDSAMAPGQRQVWYPWPYVEGLAIEEAANDLAFLVTGAYGKPLARQMGAPLRLAVPWKYGFKSIKSIVRFTFTEERPKTFWETIQPAEYGFWANVNPEVPHPRWSQATEKILGTGERVPTVIYNGYGALVADLYRNMGGEKLFM
ncbi:sulfoxide reductase catalytic subunit YedY [Tepidamorphus gemmatus]|uniref:Protein-methionine-sulfoxide reductase catalytic subunit MsrP n=1 Tax=Tepidamorphus gemmatus TaxID=747076 RepID=A0A4R3MJS6_9HYPH|nr:protein-methionine-sulfoxide reductase catalytic subunit MsrP [Tepidamorphus gemmatus]TCT13684.1 sulfoxide reductase catalytic subunit YedY [Tepidamorphus gemmatus]